MLNTAQLRVAWAPRCRGPWVTVPLHGDGRVTVRASIVDAVLALNAVLVRWSYRTRRGDTGAFACRQITGGEGDSLHAFGIALDLNWATNPYGRRLVTDMPRGMVAEIKAIRTRSGVLVWRWGGDFRTVKDAMHFEIMCAPRDIASGIMGVNPSARIAPKPPMPSVPNIEEDDVIALVKGSGATIWSTNWITKTRLSPEALRVVQWDLAARGLPAHVSTLTDMALESFPTTSGAEDVMRAIAAIRETQ